MPTTEGIPTNWALFPANLDEREGAMDLLMDYQNLLALGDKGFLDHVRQEILDEERGVVLLTPKRCNQAEQNPKEWDALLNRLRRMIETTLWGVLSRLIAKITGMTIAAWRNQLNGRTPLQLAEFTF